MRFIITLFLIFKMTYANDIQDERVKFLDKDLSHIKDEHELFHLKTPEDYDHCPNMGYCHVKDKEVLHVLRTNQKVVYDISYDMDSFRRRKTPIDTKGKYHLITSGCSFVFGTGLRKDETLAYYLAQEVEDVTPYNYGLAGSGTNSMTAQTESFIHHDAIKEPQGYMIYALLNFHIARSNALSMEREWLWDTPVYGKRDNEFKNLGTFKEAQPVTTWLYHKVQQIFQLLGLKLNFPPLRTKHYEYTCHLIHKARQTYKARFPSGRFVVYDHPYDEVHPKLLSCLKKKLIEVIPSNLTITGEDTIEHDGHPSAKLNIRIAKEISNYLKKEKPLDVY